MSYYRFQHYWQATQPCDTAKRHSSCVCLLIVIWSPDTPYRVNPLYRNGNCIWPILKTENSVWPWRSLICLMKVWKILTLSLCNSLAAASIWLNNFILFSCFNGFEPVAMNLTLLEFAPSSVMSLGVMLAEMWTTFLGIHVLLLTCLLFFSQIAFTIKFKRDSCLNHSVTEIEKLFN